MYFCQNIFWLLHNTDVYSAICWDRLHAYIIGLFASHLWEQFKLIVDLLGREAAKLIDIQYVQFATSHAITFLMSGQSQSNSSLEWAESL